MSIYYRDDVLLSMSNPTGFEDYIKQAGLKQMKEEANTEDISKEEYYLYDIIGRFRLFSPIRSLPVGCFL